MVRAVLCPEPPPMAVNTLRDVAWRTMTSYDLNDVEEIASKVHPTLYEHPDVLAERQRLYHNGCYILELGDKAVGYVLSHPWRSDNLPELNTELGKLPDDPDTYYLHDLALLPVARRLGTASQIVQALVKHAAARSFATIRLVAVNNSRAFWEKQGFAVEDAPALADKLQTYDMSAVLMVRNLP
jgi:ribosomal protein S18 acetylase RimI-like enzyme